jgi:triacylglycerol lipase
MPNTFDRPARTAVHGTEKLLETTMHLRRRFFLVLTSSLATSLALLTGCATQASLEQAPPIVFVHGNGDSAALWQTTIWRFESNGWPRERLHAIELPNPLARDVDSKEQAGRTSTAQAMAYL